MKKRIARLIHTLFPSFFGRARFGRMMWWGVRVVLGRKLYFADEAPPAGVEWSGGVEEKEDGV